MLTSDSINSISSNIGAQENHLADKFVIHQIDINLILYKIYSMTNAFIQSIPVIFLGLISLALFFVAGRIIRTFIKQVMRDRKNYNVALVLARIAQWTLNLIGILVTLAIIFPSVTLADILAGFGLGSIALGFAFKDVLQNSLSGILILLQEPFKIGDEIKYKEFEGEVEFIDTRTTFIKTYNGKRILIPNGEIYANATIVNTSYPSICTEYDIGIKYQEDIQKTAHIILESLKSIEDILDQPEPEVLVIELNDYKILVRARWWTTPRHIHSLRVKSEALKSIKQKLQAADIIPTFPRQIVFLNEQAGASKDSTSTLS